MERRVGFGQLMPDLPSLENPGLEVATNAIPQSIGYGAMRGLGSIGQGTLAARARGAIAAIDNAGNASLIAGTQSQLLQQRDGVVTDISAPGGYSTMTKEGWEFVQFNQLILAATYTADLQSFSLLGETQATPVPGAPRARHLGVVRDHLVAGNLYSSVDGPAANRVQWSAIGNPLSWPIPGTDEAVAAQSDKQDLEGRGVVQAIVEGIEVGAVLQEGTVWRMDYAGGNVIYNFSRIEPDRGSLLPGVACAFGREFIYCYEDGWHRCDYTQSRPIGEERINRTFLADLDTAYLDRVTCVRDPDRPLIYIGYPGQGNTGGTPNKLMIYNFFLDRFSFADVEHELLANVVVPGTSSIDALPDDNVDTFEPTTSFDDRPTTLGAIRVGGYDTSHTASDFSGPWLRAIFDTGHLEFSPGRRSKIQSIRPLVRGGFAGVRVKGFSNRNSVGDWSNFRSQDQNGNCSILVDARYHQIRTEVMGPFEEAVGDDVMFIRTGRK